MDKKVLDVCCGGKMFWFQKHNQSTLYIDKRKEDNTLIKNRKEFSVDPDMISDFRNLPFKNNQFKLIIFDPPHFKSLGKTSWMAKKYGVLDKETWEDDLKKGFDECWRVLDVYGTLVFKWNQSEIKLKDILSCFSKEPLFGQKTTQNRKTIWCVFFKENDLTSSE